MLVVADNDDDHDVGDDDEFETNALHNVATINFNPFVDVMHHHHRPVVAVDFVHDEYDHFVQRSDVNVAAFVYDDGAVYGYEPKNLQHHRL